ncbi:MAG: S8 family serine peptidase [Saprospiraceae bacterium]|nr:S8 family serine peptidase [Saprospiraceae bacterium]
MKIILDLVFFVYFFSIVFQGYSINNNNWQDKVSPQLLRQLENKEKEYFLVYLNKQTAIPEHDLDKNSKAEKAYQILITNLETQEDIVNILSRGKYEFRRYYIVNAISVYGDINLVITLASRNDVNYISFDSPSKSEDSYLDISGIMASPEPTWGISIINADQVWNIGYTGHGIVVGGQDTGYDWKHPALKDKYRGNKINANADHNYNWHDAIHEINSNNNDSIPDPKNNPCGLNAAEPCDDHSHGTHTMGTMAGQTDSLLIGVAPGAKWIGCRNMERGWGKPSTYIECFEWFLAPTDLNGKNPDPSKSPDVINNSWSCPVSEGCDPTNWQYMELALNNLRASGVFVVVSAGNDGINNCGSINTPAAMFERSFTVGATKKLLDTLTNTVYDTIASFSSRGPVIIDNSFRLKPDISAPGQKILSSVPGNKYSYSSGTSMAGPHVAGVVALVLSANTDLRGNTNRIEEILESTADPKPEVDECRNINEKLVPNSIFGHGRINALAAVNRALEIKTSVPEKLVNESDKYVVFPNPCFDIINIKGERLQEEAQISIIDNLGNKIYDSKQIIDSEIFVNDWQAGIYFVKINDEKSISVIKVIKL